MIIQIKAVNHYKKNFHYIQKWMKQLIIKETEKHIK